MFYKDKTVLITGGTGTMGSAFVRYLLALENPPKKIIILSRGEYKQHLLQIELRRDDILRFFIGDIRDRNRLFMAFKGVDIIVHAAAMKQVPACEYSPFEAIQTNVMGAQYIVEASIYNNVRQVLAISTDKCVEPINLYGATKNCMEKLFIAANSYGVGKTIFSCCRYGNVAGSRGSVIPKFKELKRIGEAELPITSIEMTRFWMDLSKAVETVDYSLKNMQGEEIFIPLCKSFRMTDLIQAMDSKYKVVGIRQGEKLHEKLLTKHEIIYIQDSYYRIYPHTRNLKEQYEVGGEKCLSIDYSSCNNFFMTVEELKEKIDKI